MIIHFQAFCEITAANPVQTHLRWCNPVVTSLLVICSATHFRLPFTICHLCTAVILYYIAASHVHVVYIFVIPFFCELHSHLCWNACFKETATSWTRSVGQWRVLFLFIVKPIGCLTLPLHCQMTRLWLIHLSLSGAVTCCGHRRWRTANDQAAHPHLWWIKMEV